MRVKNILPFRLPSGDPNPNDDLFISYNSTHEVDYFCFFDSRGSTLEQDKSFSMATLLVKEFERLGKRYVVICRPVRITVFLLCAICS